MSDGWLLRKRKDRKLIIVPVLTEVIQQSTNYETTSDLDCECNDTTGHRVHMYITQDAKATFTLYRKNRHLRGVTSNKILDHPLYRFSSSPVHCQCASSTAPDPKHYGPGYHHLAEA